MGARRDTELIDHAASLEILCWSSERMLVLFDHGDDILVA